ncbi:MOSC N-terminal beta barrel domain-containing protein [Rhodobacteraceae bacterium M382]|nr:MOSC N-terminal beta barrel domain-containing protein [Rhodobacteraceae bacterium M382]
MTGSVTQIWRHPIKSHGREALDQIALTAGQTMPGDRLWAVAHELSTADGSEWVPCQNFNRGSKAPRLMAIDARLDDATGRMTLTHPDLPDLTFSPDDEADHTRFLDWAGSLIPENRAASARLMRCPRRGWTDTDLLSVTLCNAASHRAVERAIGHPLATQRWRGNLWFDGLAEWQEFDWIDREIQIGDAVLIPRERTERCLATTANPATGERDADTLGTLMSQWGHKDFSVRAEVLRSGTIRIGDQVKVL